MNDTPKIALVTGAASGSGRGCALALLDAGWRVVFSARRVPRAAATQMPYVGRGQ
jgi:NAD(P)-dependent dehydrogenase (short-subunit alcohol dehydrogenase family)